MPRESSEFDVVIVGAGPAGLSAACRLGQLASSNDSRLSVCVVEKGAEVGAHIVSGAVIDTRALDELFPDWRARGAPVQVAVTSDRLAWLRNSRSSLAIPSVLVPLPLRARGQFIVSLGRLCRWLAVRAQELGCDVLPTFAATEVLYDDHGAVVGVATGDKGISRDGKPKPGMEPGYELRAKYVIFAEGCRGNLGRALETRYALRTHADPQHYGIGFKEVWEVDPAQHRAGHVLHTFGWPLENDTEGGGFVYHDADRKVSLGFVVALNYGNPHLDPFREFQRWKEHPAIRETLAGARRVGYGARALNKGGLHSLPKLVFPGGMLVGCDAGLLNGAKLKGSHTAMKSGMLAAEAVYAAIARGESGSELLSFSSALHASWVIDELRAARNFSAGIGKLGTLFGGALAFFEHNVLRGRTPFDFHDRTPDHATLALARESRPIVYPAPDGSVSFDRLSSVYLSNTRHDEDQPCHLLLTDKNVPIRDNLPRFDEPAQRYCPANVYEVVTDATGRREFVINAANCIHCKTCEIKDPAQNIDWLPPEGGSGPIYGDM